MLATLGHGKERRVVGGEERRVAAQDGGDRRMPRELAADEAPHLRPPPPVRVAKAGVQGEIAGVERLRQVAAGFVAERLTLSCYLEDGIEYQREFRLPEPSADTVPGGSG